MTRIIAGAAGSLTLRTPPSSTTRPTSDRVREAIFSSLESLAAVEGAETLDLFAGSGALGLEALSRGARRVHLVDRDARAVAACRANAASVEAACAAGRASSVEQSAVLPALDRMAQSGRSFDLVFLDPPYDVDEAELARCLAALVPSLAADATVVVERSTRSPEPTWPAGVERFRDRRYGETMVWYASHDPAPAASLD